MTTAAAEPVVVHLATHPLILALPAVIPAFLVVGVVVAIAIADRRRGDDEMDEDAPTDEVQSAADAPAADEPDRNTTPADPDAPSNRNEDDDADRKAD